jgi:hypothetical protein
MERFIDNAVLLIHDFFSVAAFMLSQKGRAAGWPYGLHDVNKTAHQHGYRWLVQIAAGS